jgi:ferric-dicitrate binding protein FerR (iron transport regulator)
VEETVSTEQRDQRQPQARAPQQPPQNPRREFAKKGILAAIGGACSGAARALIEASWRVLRGDF